MDEETVKAFFCSGATLPKGPTFVFNESRLHHAELPSVNGITNARSLARIYSLDCKEGHMKKNSLFVCLQRGQKNIILIHDCH